MTVSNLPSDFSDRIHQLDARISANLDLVPVSHWGFDERAMEMVRNRKHSLVNKTLGTAAQRKLGKSQKQKIAKNLGGIPQTISEVFTLLSGSSLASKLRKGPTALKLSHPIESKIKEEKEEETKENDESKLDPRVLELLKQKGVGKRIVGKRTHPNLNVDLKPAVPFKKPKQHKPLSVAEKQERKEKRKQTRQKTANKQKSVKNAEIKTPSSEPAKQDEKKKIEDGGMAFSKLEFVLKADEPKKHARDKFSGRDYAALHKKAQKRKEHVEQIREQNPEKAERLERNIKFETAIKRAQGEKVKDDVEKLAKAVKRKEKTKEKRKVKWNERTKKVADDQNKRQEKRQVNIDKRRDDKTKKKLERARKKGRLF